MAEPSGNRGIEYLFSDDGKCSRYVAGFWGDLSDVKDIHGQPLCGEYGDDAPQWRAL